MSQVAGVGCQVSSSRCQVPSGEYWLSIASCWLSGVSCHALRFTYHVLRFRWAFILIGLTLLFGFIVWWLFPSQDDGTLAEIQRRGRLRVGLDASFPPFETIDENGQIVGLDVDIARAMPSRSAVIYTTFSW